jgi:hypothetical protein
MNFYHFVTMVTTGITAACCMYYAPRIRKQIWVASAVTELALLSAMRFIRQRLFSVKN